MHRALLLLLVVTVAAPARADEAGPAHHSVEWDDTKPRVSPSEAFLGVSAIAAAAALEFGSSQPPEPRFIGLNPLDTAVRDALVPDDIAARRRIMTASDVLVVVAMAYPPVIDGIVVPAIERNGDLAEQLLVMDGEVLGLSALFTDATKRLAARARPASVGCSKDGRWADDCGAPDMRASFFSGHSTMSAAAAGLTCAHHAYLPLYGGGAPDIVACASMSALALTIGTLRIAADRHWTTDVLTGWAVGFGLGLGLPIGLHYAERVPEKRVARAALPIRSAAPTAFTWSGAF